MPAAGRKLSQASKYSWVAAGPPCRSSNFAVGLFPTRLVQTWNSPLGVVIGIILAPPPRMSGRPVLSKYVSALIGTPWLMRGYCADVVAATSVAIGTRAPQSGPRPPWQ